MRLLKHAMVTAAATGLMLGMVHPPSGATNIGQQGCTPGYWKNHTEDWPAEYAPGQLVGSVFTGAGSFSGLSLEQALALQGGSGTAGAQQILLRAATAAVLNADDERIGYPYRRFREPLNIIASVNGALGSNDRARMLALATTLDQANNLGCPL